MRKLCVFFDNDNIVADAWIFSFLEDSKKYFKLSIINKSPEPPLMDVPRISEAIRMPEAKKQLDFLEANEINVVLDITGVSDGDTLALAKRAGVQIRIVYLSIARAVSDRKSSMRKVHRNATKIVGQTEGSLKLTFPMYHRYLTIFRALDLPANTVTDPATILKSELNAPLRAEGIRLEKPLIRWIWTWVKRYDHKAYWRMRFLVVNSQTTSRLKKMWYLFRIKRTDAFHNSSFGTGIDSGAQFETPPYLPHGPNGIIVGHDCVIGREVTIYQQVTIMQGNVSIGNNVMLGAGCKILPNVRIGDNVKVGANCVVVDDVPDGATVVLPKPRLILPE